VPELGQSRIDRGCRRAWEPEMGMRKRSGLWLVFPAVVSVSLAGCAGFWDLPAGSGSGTGSGASGVFYVLNQESAGQSPGQIVAYSISSSGISNIASYNVTGGPTAIAIAPNGSYLYVSTLTSGVFVYSIGSNGALTLGNNSEAITDDIASAIAVDTTSGWLIEALATASNQVQLKAVPLNSSGTYTTGTTVPETPAFTINSGMPTVKQIAISSDDANIFEALGAGGTIVVPFDSSDPFPSNMSATVPLIPVLHGGADLSVAVDPSNRLFYIGETADFSTTNDSGGIRFFNYSSLTSTLTEASGSPIASAGDAPNTILPLASYVYVGNGIGTSTGNIAWFSFASSGTTYSLSTGSDIGAGIAPSGLAEDNTGTYLLAVSSGGDYDLETYTMSSGALTSFKSTATGTDPVGAVAIGALP
jgi:hypothetical protein